jgi:hypothetical protein
MSESLDPLGRVAELVLHDRQNLRDVQTRPLPDCGPKQLTLAGVTNGRRQRRPQRAGPIWSAVGSRRRLLAHFGDDVFGDA